MPRAFTAEEVRRIRGALLEAGRKAITGAGFRRTSVGQLTRAAGISQGAFYQFFPSKADLLYTLLADAEAAVRERLVHAAHHGSLDDFVHVLFDAVRDDPMLHTLRDPDELAWLMRTLPSDFAERARADDDAFHDGVVDILRARGLVGEDVDGALLTDLGRAVMGIEQQRAYGGERYERAVGILRQGIVQVLSC